jgi:hypothetical protein
VDAELGDPGRRIAAAPCVASLLATGGDGRVFGGACRRS